MAQRLRIDGRPQRARSRARGVLTAVCVGLLALSVVGVAGLYAEDEARDPNVRGEVLPERMNSERMEAMSVGCLDCHVQTDAPTMHKNPAVTIGCADCHGGKPEIRAEGLVMGTPEYEKQKLAAHVLPKNKKVWKTSRNPEGSYTDLLKESVEFVRFVNPGDMRAAPEACGGCHAKIVGDNTKSLMATSAMLAGGAAYNNGILPNKVYVLGEGYGRDGEGRTLVANPPPTDAAKARGALEKLLPIPQWEVIPPADVFRVFERGGLFIKSQFAEVGLPNPLEDPGKPDVRSSNRGPGTGQRVAIPVLNMYKTRLNDPHLSFMGTNDHPGDYRSSGCTGCHVIYANDRSPVHSGPYAKFGHEGKTQTIDPTIPKDEEGHPLKHVFTRSIPTSQCMVCHMHQPNMFVNSYLGYTMWDYETDAKFMFPKKQKYPTNDEIYESWLHNPEQAAERGLWSDKEFLKRVSDMNPQLEDTQFADYHGHGWNFRAIFKRDRKGNLLDKNDKVVPFTDPKRFQKAVHLKDIHLEKGMHCVDCHFQQDAHGDGNIYGEVAQQVEIRCQDCHGTSGAVATLLTSGPASKTRGPLDLSLKRTPFGDRQFEWRGGSLWQRSTVTEGLEWRVKQTVHVNDPLSGDYNAKSARAHTVRKFSDDSSKEVWGRVGELKTQKGMESLAHNDEEMSCFTCHSSWMTSCFGCHLPIQANFKSRTKHYDGKETRNWASYNPQVVRDDVYFLGKHGPAKNGIISPVRSSSALVLSSTDVNRQRIYIQQPPIASSGHSSQAFAPHFPHTVRTKETKQCTDCHVSKDGDNNAWLASLLMQGTNFVNFMGFNAWVATGEHGLQAVQVTEWDEPQAVIGSHLHKYAYPDFYNQHEARGRELAEYHSHHGAGGITNTIQLRGEYLYTTAGEGGFRVYDVANVANKGFSERMVTSPVSPLGQDTHVPTKNATSFALPTNMPLAPFRKQLPENLETPIHEIYHYAVVVDSEEGLILVNIDTLTNFEPRDNFLERALTWNERGILDGARHVSIAGTNVFVSVPDGVVVLDLDTPLEPKVVTKIDFDRPTATAVQFRYLFVTDADGLHTVDITNLECSKLKPAATVRLDDARHVYVARTFAYVAGGREGLVIVDVERPEHPKVYMRYTDDGKINDLNDVKVASTNASLFAYLADGENGLKVLQLTDPVNVPGFYGFSPNVKPRLIAWHKTNGHALAVSKGLDRDRAVDESGHQVSILGRLGSRPFNLEEMRKLFVRPNGDVWTVSDK